MGDSASMTMPPGGSTSSGRCEGEEEKEDPAPALPEPQGGRQVPGRLENTESLDIFPLEKVLILWLSTMVRD